MRAIKVTNTKFFLNRQLSIVEYYFLDDENQENKRLSIPSAMLKFFKLMKGATIQFDGEETFILNNLLTFNYIKDTIQLKISDQNGDVQDITVLPVEVEMYIHFIQNGGKAKFINGEFDNVLFAKNIN